MTHFGVICLGATGHINTMFPLAGELLRRGHKITVFSGYTVQAKAISAGFNFRAIGKEEFTPDKVNELFQKQGKLQGLAGLRLTLDSLKNRTQICLQETPDAVKEAGVEALLVDMSAFEGGTVADFLNLPYITVCSALSFYREELVPPVSTTWGYNPAFWARLRNNTAHNLCYFLGKPIFKAINKYRQQWNLPLYANCNDLFSKLAIIAQHPVELEFPRLELPPYFHFTGPFHDSTGRPSIDFPFDKLNGQPLIYASLGTIRNCQEYLFRIIVSACVDLDAQLVLSLGGSLNPKLFADLPSEVIVVQYAPQLELLQRASLTITHAGMNTTLESLSNGVPLVAIPISDEQPGIAARIVWSGVGEMVNLKDLNPARLRETVKRVLTQESYKQNALRLQQAIRRAGGVKRAGDIAEQVVRANNSALVR